MCYACKQNCDSKGSNITYTLPYKGENRDVRYEVHKNDDGSIEYISLNCMVKLMKKIIDKEEI